MLFTYLRSPKRRKTREECAVRWEGICITSSLNKRAEDKQGRLSFSIQITFTSEHLHSFSYSLQAKSLIWQVMFILEMNLCKQIQASVSPYACWWPECKCILQCCLKGGPSPSALSPDQQGVGFLFPCFQNGWVQSTGNSVFLALRIIKRLPWFHISFSHNTFLQWTTT